ncbi:class I SAM-dependent methyltransferase [Pseudobutyrivibrio xylanivorans]|uniref:Class I SAM-dependent methyltransferase n=1 Tax=Pseudobutyrivibrio xylanivorans TaxID=185007 RepID=A0A5P6VQQ0_PSEXY|nr:class I SAM-dependent methyltransferase [Pseudobutyrivibrio xylanivorans]QFJ54678.1 class I SAM-dependent methyltransferase [Pseudobutyrivibrio xylanivorans]
MDVLEKENRAYWQQRAAGYSEVNKEELAGVQRNTWTSFLTAKISERFPNREPETISILDVGAGPGFISIILAEAGYKVTAFDFSDEMLKEARANAGELASKITFRQGDAMDLPFDKEVFDVVFSRNLIWNIPFPEKAYEQWLRVLKPEGLMMVFDANWYAFLVDDEKKAEFEQDRKNVAAEGLGDYNIGENFDQMDVIASKMPSTRRLRPQWDKEFLESISAGWVETYEDIGQILYSEKEKINYKSTPLFMVQVIKG